MSEPENNDTEFQNVLRSLESQSLGGGPAGPPDGMAGARPSVRVRVPLVVGAPWAARALLVLNIVIFALPWLLSVATGQPFDLFVLALGAKDNQAIALGGEYYRFLTAMFLHGGPAHIAFNSWALYALGFETERVYGTPRFLVLYLLAGLGGGVASYALNPNPSVGASGAIFGLIGALGAFYYVARRVLGGIAREQLGSLVFITLINIGLGLTTPSIDNNAHIGGLVTGALAGWLLAPRFVVEARIYPPRISRRPLPLGWAGVLGIFILLVILIAVIRPPM